MLEFGQMELGVPPRPSHPLRARPSYFHHRQHALLYSQPSPRMLRKIHKEQEQRKLECIFHVTPVSTVKTKLISELPLPDDIKRHINTFLGKSRTIRYVPYIYSAKYEGRYYTQPRLAYSLWSEDWIKKGRPRLSLTWDGDNLLERRRTLNDNWRYMPMEAKKEYLMSERLSKQACKRTREMHKLILKFSVVFHCYPKRLFLIDDWYGCNKDGKLVRLKPSILCNFTD